MTLIITTTKQDIIEGVSLVLLTAIGVCFVAVGMVGLAGLDTILFG
jgi:hypothetical protein